MNENKFTESACSTDALKNTPECDRMTSLIQAIRVNCVNAFRQIVVASSLSVVMASDDAGATAKDVAAEQFLNVLTSSLSDSDFLSDYDKCFSVRLVLMLC